MNSSNKIFRRVTVVAMGVFAAGALTVPLAQAAPSDHMDRADKPACTAEQIDAARAETASKMAALFEAHPELKDRAAQMKDLPRDQRKAQAQANLNENPELAAAVKDARSAKSELRQECSVRGAR
ncbi:hemophore-related protein [Rhodococcus marinonascens]|uniref:hemophore-related protein n=1 Tax=Rhodococcus marinonascens TaxID=38311 RepID=UPI0009327D1A|nr:hemophore-related protein [Rhodococcus marinonascens]